MLWLLLPLALTGYLIQVLVASGGVHAAGWSHAALGAFFLVGYAVHPKRRSPPPVSCSPAGPADSSTTFDMHPWLPSLPVRLIRLPRGGRRRVGPPGDHVLQPVLAGDHRRP